MLCFVGVVHAKTEVPLYTYFDKPPFIISKSQQAGLSFELADKLNRFSESYQYKIVYLPKQRALAGLESPAALLWVNPTWVNDTNKTKYWWSSELIHDRELYISNDLELEYSDDSSLFGKTLVGARGYIYFNLQQYIKNGTIKHIDVNSESLIPQMLMKGRGDFGVIGFQTYFYLVKTHPEYIVNLKILNNYVKMFERSIVVSRADTGVQKDIEAFLNSKHWTDLANKWLTPQI